MTQELPPPGTVVEMYLAAICDRLGEIRDRLPAPSADEERAAGLVELREPAAPRAPAAASRPGRRPAGKASKAAGKAGSSTPKEP